AFRQARVDGLLAKHRPALDLHCTPLLQVQDCQTDSAVRASRRVPQRLHRIERVDKAVPTGGRRPELCDTCRPLPAGNARIETPLTAISPGQRTRLAVRSPPPTALVRCKCHRL